MGTGRSPTRRRGSCGRSCRTTAASTTRTTTYTWADAFAAKVATLNGGGGFAGYTDWRVPNLNELESLVNLGAVNPAVSPAFNTGCVPACTVLVVLVHAVQLLLVVLYVPGRPADRVVRGLLRRLASTAGRKSARPLRPCGAGWLLKASIRPLDFVGWGGREWGGGTPEADSRRASGEPSTRDRSCRGGESNP